MIARLLASQYVWPCPSLAFFFFIPFLCIATHRLWWKKTTTIMRSLLGPLHILCFLLYPRSRIPSGSCVGFSFSAQAHLWYLQRQAPYPAPCRWKNSMKVMMLPCDSAASRALGLRSRPVWPVSSPGCLVLCATFSLSLSHLRLPKRFSSPLYGCWLSAGLASLSTWCPLYFYLCGDISF